MLIDEAWAKILRDHNISVSVSIDGPPEIHDTYRVDMKGKGTHAQTMKGVENLRKVGIEPGFLSVCNPSTDPATLLKYVVEEIR